MKKNRQKYSHFAVSLLTLIMLLTACQAPHDNPFDPQSKAYIPDSPPDHINDLTLDSLVDLRCRLTWTAPGGARLYALYSGLPGWDGSDTTGGEPYNGELPGVKPAGTEQSVWIELPPAETRAWVLFSISESGLMSGGSNAVVIAAPARNRPAEVSVGARSIHQASWGSLPYLALEIRASISDPDGVDRVWVKCDTMELGTLQSTGDTMTWLGHFPEAGLNGLRIADLVGYPLTLYHLDNAHFVAASDPFYLIRVIDDMPEVIAPDNDVVLYTTQPQLEWEPFGADFRFTYKIEILHVPDGTSEGNRVYLAEDIPSDSTVHTVNSPLTTEPQYLVWTVAAVDEFGDEARSLTARFRISGEDE